ncbi:pyridoxamine 5'-phosphate oxidase family protein [Nitrosopumilus sp. K4]|uniref:pyridoxamine 5'-phosphate oxidase family protein n=1 Tax=Nitrosopumilus sp. K4 TaxID=2795383 RepID=UPI001BAD56CD|nr:pyridoxamine 5'-phosphate oxidase family protein [Nitrosopumilus sp. K4]QUC65248.1 pyridoxamine 5'-phosphate oxidase family protein [Nitrosopumilus sp. K4]
MIEFTHNERKFLESLEESRIATSHNDIPHVKPVSYVFLNSFIFVATDYGTRTLQNLKKNPNVAISIDVYKSGEHKAVCIQGVTEIIEKGEEFKKIYDVFFEKFAWVRKEPWKENEAPFLKIIPKTKVSWGT